MLKFLRTTTNGAHETWTTSELFQIVDVRANKAAIAEGKVRVEAAVRLNPGSRR
jgi:hypothetical protein